MRGKRRPEPCGKHTAARTRAPYLRQYPVIFLLVNSTNPPKPPTKHPGGSRRACHSGRVQGLHGGPSAPLTGAAGAVRGRIHRMSEVVPEVIQGLVTGLYACACDFFSHRRAKSFRIKTLKSRLLKGGHKWRSLKQLARAIGQSEEATTDLLIEIGARRSAGEKNVWTLQK